MLLAAALAAAWVVVFVSAFAAFRRAHTTLIPNRPATAFVTSGPYHWTRNPMYLGLALLYLAVALWMNNWWVVLLLVVVLFVIQTAVIAREERYLRAAYPSEYAAYCTRVRRWL